MPLPPKSERLHIAHRSAHVARLVSRGWSPERAEAGVAAWEEHADAEGRERGRQAFWDGAEAWIVSRPR
jgi:hypothetical protein